MIFMGNKNHQNLFGYHLKSFFKFLKSIAFKKQKLKHEKNKKTSEYLKRNSKSF